MRTVLPPIELQEETSVGLEKSGSDVVDEELPIGRRPFLPLAVFVTGDAVETDAMCSDQVEFFSEVRQRRLRVYSSNHAPHTEQLRRSAKERLVIGVQANSFVAEVLAKIQKIPGPTPEIENVERLRAVQPKVLDTLYIHIDPILRLVCIDLPRIRR